MPWPLQSQGTNTCWLPRCCPPQQEGGHPVVRSLLLQRLRRACHAAFPWCPPNGGAPSGAVTTTAKTTKGLPCCLPMVPPPCGRHPVVRSLLLQRLQRACLAAFPWCPPHGGGTQWCGHYYCKDYKGLALLPSHGAPSWGGAPSGAVTTTAKTTKGLPCCLPMVPPPWGGHPVVRSLLLQKLQRACLAAFPWCPPHGGAPSGAVTTTAKTTKGLPCCLPMVPPPWGGHPVVRSLLLQNYKGLALLPSHGAPPMGGHPVVRSLLLQRLQRACHAAFPWCPPHWGGHPVVRSLLLQKLQRSCLAAFPWCPPHGGAPSGAGHYYCKDYKGLALLPSHGAPSWGGHPVVRSLLLQTKGLLPGHARPPSCGGGIVCVCVCVLYLSLLCCAMMLDHTCLSTFTTTITKVVL